MSETTQIIIIMFSILVPLSVGLIVSAMSFKKKDNK